MAGRLGVGLLQCRLDTSPVAFDAIVERPRLDYKSFGAGKLDLEPFEVSVRLPQQDQRIASGFARFLGLAFASFTLGVERMLVRAEPKSVIPFAGLELQPIGLGLLGLGHRRVAATTAVVDPLAQLFRTTDRGEVRAGDTAKLRHFPPPVNSGS